MPRIVIDASVAAKWFFTDEVNSKESLLLTSLDSYDLIAPEYIYTEIANSIWRAIDVGRFNKREILEKFDQIISLNLITLKDCKKLYSDAIDLCLKMQHKSIYDCIYFPLAFSQNTKLVTADDEFIRRVRKSDYKKAILSLNEI